MVAASAVAKPRYFLCSWGRACGLEPSLFGDDEIVSSGIAGFQVNLEIEPFREEKLQHMLLLKLSLFFGQMGQLLVAGFAGSCLHIECGVLQINRETVLAEDPVAVNGIGHLQQIRQIDIFEREMAGVGGRKIASYLEESACQIGMGFPDGGDVESHCRLVGGILCRYGMRGGE